MNLQKTHQILAIVGLLLAIIYFAIIIKDRFTAHTIYIQ